MTNLAIRVRTIVERGEEGVMYVSFSRDTTEEDKIRVEDEKCYFVPFFADRFTTQITQRSRMGISSINYVGGEYPKFYNAA